MSRRQFLAAVGSAAALAALDGCSSSSHANSPTSARAPTSTSTSAPTTTTTTVPRVPGQRPDPTRPEGANLIPQIEHIVVVMQENHSYDSYFGMLPRGDGFRLDAHGRPLASNPDAHGNPVRAFHMANTCQAQSLSQNWNSSHMQWNNGALDGFVRSPSGAAAMGYWDGTDVPFYYGLATTFPVCDRWFASCLAQTYPNRRFVLCGSALGTISTDITQVVAAPKNGTIFDALSRNNISWRDYYTDLPSVLLFLDVFTRHRDKVQKLDHFFADAAAGALPAFCLVESGAETQTEENPQDLSRGEAFTAKVVNALMSSPNWPTTMLVFCYDEHGGYYDHVAPPAAVAPDDILPMLAVHPGDHLSGQTVEAPGDYTRLGFRVPAAIVSPYARPNYVSHVVHDHTSILSLVEHKWNLPALTRRDGAADNLLDSLDLEGKPAFLTPPKLPAPKNSTGRPICTPGHPGLIPNPSG